MSERTSGFVLDLPVGAWLITAVGDYSGPPRILKRCATRAECLEAAPRFKLRDLVFVEVKSAEHWRAES